MAKKLNKKEENGVTGSMITIMIFSISLVLLLTLPNIYLDNKIYKESREIAHYQKIVDTLQEEQSIIKHKLEDIQYRGTRR
ncbi:MAG: hypothetical protein DSZ11_04475 [Sulfurovum sp.]|nr:MAG: hypothetical protein DSZ11_04475 [Sulfurovum sp.]